MKLVVDASVVVKWFFPEDGPDVGLALSLFRGVGAGRLRLVQPPHFLAEVSAVLARRSPATAADDLGDLLGIDFDTRDDAGVYRRAVQLSIDLDHHLFDTLYHAVAMETPGARLVTADQRYLRKARRAGDATIVALADAGSLLDG